MGRIAILFFSAGCVWAAQVRTLTLREAVDLALKQNPDMVLARLDEQKAEMAMRLAKDPFIPKVVAGSGLAYSSGFPMSIEGATPSILQARAISDVFNRQQSYRIAAAKENRRSVSLDAVARQEDVAYRTAELYLDTEKAGKIGETARGELDGLQRVLEVMRERVTEGRELPIELKRAELNLARGRYRVQVSDSNVRAAQTALAAALGLDPGDQVQPAESERTPPALPDSADAAVRLALANSRGLRSLEAKLVAKGFDVRAERAARLPRLDLVAQYALLARFNHYEDFFRKFQRNNGQLGVSIQVPLWSGPGIEAAANQAEAEAAQIRVQIRNLRSRLDSDTRTAYEQTQQAATASDIARLDLDVARDQVSILLAQMQEGRASMRQVEEARAAEAEKWIALYDASASLEKARYNLLRQTGSLAAALQ